MRLPPPDKYPKEIVVKDEVWKIKFVKIIGRDPNCLGITIWPDRIIKIKSTQSHPQILTTFIHELLHAISFEHDFQLPHKTVYDLERSIVDLLLVNF